MSPAVGAQRCTDLILSCSFEKVRYLTVKKVTQTINSFEIDLFGCFLIQKGDGVPVQASPFGHIGNTHLVFAHQPGQVTLNHCLSLKMKKCDLK